MHLLVESGILYDPVEKLHNLPERLHRDLLVYSVEHVELVAVEEIGREAIHPARMEASLRIRIRLDFD